MTPRQPRPSPVPNTAKQDGDAAGRWAWAEAAVWTERMLTALEQGVQGGLWFSLIDKVSTERNLRAAAAKVVANHGAPGVDHVTVEAFNNDLDTNVTRLAAALHDGSYQPQAIRRVYTPKPGSNAQRPLGIPTVRDRVVQGAIRHVVEPIVEREFAAHSYGFRPGRGCKDALRRVDDLLRQGYVYVVDADLRRLRLIATFRQAGIRDGLRAWEPEAGAPQGAVRSPLLSNIYRNPLDQQMAQQGYQMIRYADDFVILCRSQAEAEQALTRVRQWCSAEGLQRHPTKTKVVDVRVAGFDFLGSHFQATRRGRRTRWPRPKSMQKRKGTIRAKTKRTNGHSLAVIIADVNRTLRGWFGYFQHSCRQTFVDVDGWVRMRLRSILRKRAGRQGRGRGRDHQRWTKAFFAGQGYFSLEAAFAAGGQPPGG